MKGYLVEGGVNWADEIDFDGYVIVNEKTFESEKNIDSAEFNEIDKDRIYKKAHSYEYR